VQQYEPAGGVASSALRPASYLLTPLLGQSMGVGPDDGGDMSAQLSQLLQSRGGGRSARYGLHITEHMEMTPSGLPAVSAAALARVKGRARAPQPKLSVALRRGKWSTEEELFTNVIVETFKEGVLPLADGTTLRTYVSGQLHW